MKNGKQLICPLCGKRAFDISDLPKEKIVVEIKCPNCHNLVRIPCDISAVRKNSFDRIAAYASCNEHY